MRGCAEQVPAACDAVRDQTVHIAAIMATPKAPSPTMSWPRERWSQRSKALLLRSEEGTGWLFDDTGATTCGERQGNWRSPLTGHRGFHDLTLAPTRRHGLLPDMLRRRFGNGRTPYFRYDRLAIFVSTCRQHGTPFVFVRSRRHRATSRLTACEPCALNGPGGAGCSCDHGQTMLSATSHLKRRYVVGPPGLEPGTKGL